MKLTITAISDPKQLVGFKETLDVFIEKFGDNPFYLSAFLEKQMRNSTANGSAPVILFSSINGEIIGLAPILITKKAGINFAEFIFKFYFSPDFVIDQKYLYCCLKSFLLYMFDNLGCRFVIFDVPSDSPNLTTLKRLCNDNSIPFRMGNNVDFEHAVLNVQSSWDDFQKSKSSNFRHRFKSIAKKLDNAGQWQISCFENIADEANVLKKIMNVEETCWKQDWRVNNDQHIDSDLLNIWEGSSCALRTCLGLKRKVWFLELNGQAIAYTLIIQYKGTAYIAKTSFNNSFKRLYAGIYVVNAAICSLFNSGDVHTIDFMTNLSFMEIWTHNRLVRVRFLMKNGLTANLLDSAVQQHALKLALNRFVPSKVRKLAPV